MVIQMGKCCSVSELQSSWCPFPKLTSICHHPLAQTHTSLSHLLLHWKTCLCTSWMPHSSNRNSDQQFENKMCYCHQEAGCNFIGLFSTCLQCLMFISLNVKLSSDCSGALQRRSPAECHTDRTKRNRNNLPYSNWCSLHAHMYDALGYQNRSKNL